MAYKTYFSMFAGIGGFDLALNRQGLKCVGYSEIDKWATYVYRYNFGSEVMNFGDATKLVPTKLPDFEVLCGGFPCQAFSVAGKRRGFSDTRGTLFFDICRVAKTKKPRLVFLENVKGLLNHDKGNTFATIIDALSGLGYDCGWQVLNSKDFGVPQNRERMIIVGHLRGEPRPKIFPLRGTDEETDRKKQNELIYVGSTRDKDWVGDGKNLSRHAPEGYRVYDIEGLAPTLRSQLGGDCGGSQLITACLTPDRLEKRQNGRRFKEPEEPMFTLNGQDQHGILQINNPIHSNDRVYSDEGISPTLNTMQGGMRQPFIKDEMMIRRLTPLECERLQSFPDSWTKYGLDEKGNKIEISDSQRYKMCGNAVTVNVIQEIVKKI
jgi:DNA (cytosine-5)-methyltransferase 1